MDCHVADATRLARFGCAPDVTAFRTSEIVHPRRLAAVRQQPGVRRLAVRTRPLEWHWGHRAPPDAADHVGRRTRMRLTSHPRHAWFAETVGWTTVSELLTLFLA